MLSVALWLAVAACGDDGGVFSDGGPTKTDGTGNTDGNTTGLYPCDKPGKSCNAHDPCAIDPVCGADGWCRPTKVQSCDDGLDCTIDSCKGLGECEHKPKEGTCKLTVEESGQPVEKCFNTDERNPADPCRVCDPKTNMYKWSPASGGVCDDGNDCTKEDYCQDELACTEDKCDGKGGCLGNALKTGFCLINQACYADQEKSTDGCNICDVSKSTSTWTPLSVHCLIAGKCYKPGELDPTGCSECDPTKNPSGWTPLSGKCLIDGKCYKNGDNHFSGTCAKCDVAKSPTAWTTTGTGCLIDKTCRANNTTDATGCGICDPSKSHSTWTPVSNKCLIDGKCYSPQAQHPTGTCAQCDPAKNDKGWTVSTTACLIDAKCYVDGATDTTGCAECDPPSSNVAWTPLAGKCKIDGKCYPTGAKDLTTCGECDPALSASTWSVKGNKCLVAGKCYNPQDPDTSGCGVCDPTKSKTTFSPVSNKCLVGQKCYANGDKEGGPNCLACSYATTPSGWSAAAAGTTVNNYGFEDGKAPTGWSLTGTAGTTVGWNVSSLRPASGSYSLYYGDPSTKDFDTGAANAGSVKLPAVALAASKKAGLRFWLYMDTESGTSFDVLTVAVNGVVVWTKNGPDDFPPVPGDLITMQTWQQIYIDLSTYAGQSIAISFDFDTTDSVANSTEGLYIDDIAIYYGC
jgi:hypothetical protein